VNPGCSAHALVVSEVLVALGRNRNANGGAAVFNVLGKGDIFGEIALLDGNPRTADATAATDCELFVIERRDFLPLMREEPDIALGIIEILCSKLRWTTEQAEEVMFLDLPSRLAKALVRLVDADTAGTRSRGTCAGARETRHCDSNRAGLSYYHIANPLSREGKSSWSQSFPMF
jgi:CRP-like cAMP-binding protein